jgi:hypothetical protein
MAAVRHPGADQHAEQHAAPDAEAAVPDPQRVPGVFARLEVELVVGDDVVDARADDSGGNCP